MIWNYASKILIFATLVIIGLCSGCGSTYIKSDRFGYKDHIDLSTAAASGVATIRGTNRTLLGLAHAQCWIKSPVNAKRVTVNAGPIEIVVMCAHSDEVLESMETYESTFHFDALADHEYEIGGRCRNCIRLRDATSNKVVAENPEYSVVSLDVGGIKGGLSRPKPEEMITIDPGEELVVNESYIKFYECRESYVLAQYPIKHYWLIKKDVRLSCVAPGFEMTTIEPGEEVIAVPYGYVRFYKCARPYVMVESKSFTGLSSTLTCEESNSFNDE